MRRVAAIVTVLIVCAGLCGCSGSGEIRSELAAGRQQAYQEWLSSRNGNGRQITLSGELSLKDAIQLALLHNRKLQAVREERKIAGGQITEAYSAALPTISATGSYTRLDEASSFDVGGVNVSLGFEDNYSAGLKITQPIYRGGATGAALRAARLYASLNDEKVRGVTQDTVYAVTSSYLDAVLAGYLHLANESALRSARSHLAEAKRRNVQGVASRFEVLRAEVEVANFMALTIRQKNRIELATAAFLKNMGVSQESDVMLSHELEFMPDKTSYEKAVESALKNRPDLNEADLMVRLRREALKVAVSGYLPQIDLVYSTVRARPDPHDSTLDEWGEGWSAGVVIDWPIFDGMGREGRVKQEKSALRKSRIELMDAEEKAMLEVRQSLLNLKSSEEFVRSQRLNLDRAKEALHLAEAGYSEGVNSEIEVTDARTASARATGMYYQALYDHFMARVGLQKALGILGPAASGKTGEIR